MENPAHQAGDKVRTHGLFFGYRVVIALVLTSFIPLSLGLSCAGIFYTSLSEHLGVGAGMLSYYTSILWLSSLIFLPLLGRLLGRADARIAIAGASALAALDFVWLSFTSELWQFYVGAFVMGISIAMLLFLAPSTLINRWFAKKAGFLVGIVMAFTGVGGVVWSSVGGALIIEIGWSATYLVFAALSALTVPTSIFLVASRPSNKGLAPYGSEETCEQAAASGAAIASQPAETGVPAAQAFRSPAFILIAAICFFLNFGMYVYFMIPSYAATLPLSAAMPLLGATASSAAMAGQTISKLVLGWVGDRKPYAGAIAGTALGIVGVALFALGDCGAVVFYIAAFAFGFFYGVTNVMMPIFTRRAFDTLDYPKIYARVSMAASISGALTGFVWGTLIEVTGTYLVLFGGVAAFLALTIALTVVLARRAERA